MVTGDEPRCPRPVSSHPDSLFACHPPSLHHCAIRNSTSAFRPTCPKPLTPPLDATGVFALVCSTRKESPFSSSSLVYVNYTQYTLRFTSAICLLCFIDYLEQCLIYLVENSLLLSEKKGTDAKKSFIASMHSRSFEKSYYICLKRPYFRSSCELRRCRKWMFVERKKSHHRQ